MTKTRPLEASDRKVIEEIIKAVGIFSEDEIKVALELVDESIAGQKCDYICWVLEDDVGVRGYVCFGPTPLTKGTFDLYWIAVHPSAHGLGYGKALTELVEQQVKKLGGRLLLIETASQEMYAPTVKFYERTGYELISRIPDFYKEGDDKLTFVKRIS
jgi:ribosomal protein S18 acetylase RimI-like enzyme